MNRILNYSSLWLLLFPLMDWEKAWRDIAPRRKFYLWVQERYFSPLETDLVCLVSVFKFLHCCRVGNVLLLFWKLLKIFWVEAESATWHSLDAETLHDQKLVFFPYYFCCFWWDYSAQVCTRKEGEQMTRIILYRLDIKRPTEDAVSYVFICHLLLKGK